ncbi:MAG TPA: protein phosphatase 2C domain-containing protein [Terracidiphilus sp.]|nr:protein phosphatase 2C domain-containing protein [Terracidiphilus sp.]
MPHFRSSAMTDAGPKRDHNEDTYVERPDIGLWAVADGAGGHESGELAAAMLRDALQTMPPGLQEPELIAEAVARIQFVHRALREEAARRSPYSLVAATLVVLIGSDDHYVCLWAGDARAYLLRDGKLQQLTRDHSLVQELIDAGVISRDQAATHPRANIITRAVGSDEQDVALDRTEGILRKGDLFLLCCDGVFKTLPDDTLNQLLATERRGSLADAVIRAAVAANASDNVTAVTIDVT